MFDGFLARFDHLPSNGWDCFLCKWAPQRNRILWQIEQQKKQKITVKRKKHTVYEGFFIESQGGHQNTKFGRAEIYPS